MFQFRVAIVSTVLHIFRAAETACMHGKGDSRKTFNTVQ